MIKTFLMVGLGSFLGGSTRFLLTKLIQKHIHENIPLGTLAINLSGCFFLGILYALFERGHLGNNDYRMFLTVGFCGGFTTFSTFINELFHLFKETGFGYFSLYLLLSLAGGLSTLYLGYLLVKTF